MRFLILGWARHGKDTTAEYLRDAHGVDFRSSSLFLAANVVRPALAGRGLFYDSLEACYDDRVNHRALWREIIAEHNAEDAARLAKAILDECDCYVGMRTAREYLASRDLFDVILWVDASRRGLPPEDRSSMDIDYDPARMLWIDNGADIPALHSKLDGLMRSLSWTTKGNCNG